MLSVHISPNYVKVTKICIWVNILTCEIHESFRGDSKSIV